MGFAPNPYEPHTLAWHMHENDQRDRDRTKQPIQWPKGFGEWVAGMGCVGLLLGVFWSISAVGVIGHVILIVGSVLFGMALAVAGYALILGPRLLFGRLGLSWNTSVIARSVIGGTLCGLGLGAWFGASLHGANYLRAILLIGAVGAGLGLVVGLIRRMIRGKSAARAA